MESASLSTIELPHVDFKTILSSLEDVILEGLVSNLQLETIAHMVKVHDIILPGGSRAGFLIGEHWYLYINQIVEYIQMASFYYQID